MKKTMLFILAALMLAQFGCKKNDSANNDKIIGIWTMKNEVSNYYDAAKKLLHTDTHTDGSTKYNFKADGTLTVTDGQETTNLKWSKNGNTLVITSSPISLTGQILKLTDSELSTSYIDTDAPEYFDGNNWIIAHHSEEISNFTR